MKDPFVYDPSLLLWLPFYLLDGDTFADRSAYGRLCTRTGAYWTPHGWFFDGTDDVIDCGTSTDYETAQGSLEILFTPRVGFNSETYRGIVLFGVAGWNSHLKLCRTTAGLYAMCRLADEASPYKWYIATARHVEEGQLTQVVVAQDGVSPLMYINGELMAATLAGNDVTSWTDIWAGGGRHLYISRDGGSGYPKMYGVDFKVWNRALTAQEVSEHWAWFKKELG